MSEHTEGLIRVLSDVGPCVIGTDEREIAEFYADGETQTGEDEANARRAVACWNAAEGLPTDMLEQVGKAVVPARVRYREVMDALNGMIGLVQLITGRDDVPADIRAALTTSHRYEEALAVSAKNAPVKP